MPMVKVIRHGQITLPKKVRDNLGIKEGDMLELKIGGGGIVITPKTAIDKDLARDRFFEMVEELRESVRDADPKDIEEALEEAVAAAKNITAGRLNGRAGR